MKKHIFFALLLIVFCLLYILFIDKSDYIDFWSFVPPFAVWLLFYVFYLSGGYGSALAQSKAIRGEYVVDSETEDFDEMLRKKEKEKIMFLGEFLMKNFMIQKQICLMKC